MKLDKEIAFFAIFVNPGTIFAFPLPPKWFVRRSEISRRAWFAVFGDIPNRFSGQRCFACDGPSLMRHHKFWFHDRDKRGQPINESILKTAEKIAPLLTRYRIYEIDCVSTCNEILQEAVEAASHASHRNPIANPAKYLASIYKRLVDKHLERSNKLLPADDLFLEHAANSLEGPSWEEQMHNRLVVEKLLKLMDTDTRRLCRWRLEGYSESEIAKRLGISPNSVSVRFTRGFNEAAKLLQGKRSANTNKKP